MQFSSKSGKLAGIRSQCLIVGIYQDKPLSPAAEQVDKATQGLIRDVIKAGDISGKVGQTLFLHKPAGLSSDRVLLVGCGKKGELSNRGFRKVATALAVAMKKTKAKNALCTLAEIPVQGRDPAWNARQIIETLGSAFYHYDETKSDKAPKPSLTHFHIHTGEGKGDAALKNAIKQAAAMVEGMDLCRDLGNLPGNICTPSYLAEQARELGKQYTGIKTTVLSEKQMEKLGMGSLLSVSRGSREEAKLIVMQYEGLGSTKGKKSQPVALVGKGLTFDAGGISLKPGQGMDEMKYDMCGAASVFGTIKSIAEMKLPVNVVAIIPSSENLPDGAANKPGDVVTSMSGQTIEILNTDAEGRLILCDALTYVQKKYKPAAIVDIATLTGACIVALGSHTSGVLGNDDALVEELLEAGQQSEDRAWQLPIWEEYDEQLKSNFADMANIGGREAGTITAACFLARYAKENAWAHLDIAGTAWKSGAAKGATGRPVPLLTQYLINRSRS